MNSMIDRAAKDVFGIYEKEIQAGSNEAKAHKEAMLRMQNYYERRLRMSKYLCGHILAKYKEMKESYNGK